MDLILSAVPVEILLLKAETQSSKLEMQQTVLSLRGFLSLRGLSLASESFGLVRKLGLWHQSRALQSCMSVRHGLGSIFPSKRIRFNLLHF